MFVDLGMQHAIRMRHTVICGMARLYSIFPHYLTKGTIFEKKKNIDCKMCFDFLYNFELLLVLRKIELDIIKNLLLSSRKVPVIRVRF